jgi:hypothetical protein
LWLANHQLLGLFLYRQHLAQLDLVLTQLVWIRR